MRPAHWLAPFLLFFALLGAWNVATPIGAAADEATNLIHAAAIVRGQVFGQPWTQPIPNQRVYRGVTLPATFAIYRHTCFVRKEKVSAQCAVPPVTTSRKPLRTLTYVARYPPLFYVMVGLPSFLPGGTWVVLMMRMAAVVANSALLAGAVVAVRFYGGGSWKALGLGLAMPPMVLFYSAVGNPSGFETCSSICLWCAASVLALQRRRSSPPGLVTLTVVSAAVVVQARPLSLTWPVLVAVVLAPCWVPGAYRRLRSEGLRVVSHRVVASRRARILLIVGSLSAGAALAWFIAADPLLQLPGPKPSPGTSQSTILSALVHQMPSWLHDAVGGLAWFDTPMPIDLIRFWYAAVVGLLAVALIRGSWRGRMCVLITMTLCFCVPVFSSLAAIHSRGYDTQGRYFLPLFVALPIVSATVIDQAGRERLERESRVGRTRNILIPAGVLLIAGGADVVGFGAALRRNLVGTDGPLMPWAAAPDKWATPLPPTVLDFVALTATLALILLAIRRPPFKRVADGPPSPS